MISQEKSKREAYEKLMEVSRNDGYTTKTLLDYLFHRNYYKLFSIDLSRQKNTSIWHQINFTEKLENDDDATMFCIVEKQ